MKRKIKLFGAFVMLVLVGYSISACASSRRGVVVNNGPIVWTDVRDIAYGNGMFVAGGNGKIAYSTDGINWNVRERERNRWGSINGIAYGNSRFIAVGDGVEGTDDVYRGRYFSSTDGINWTSYVSDIFVSEVKGASVGSVIGGIIYGNDKFVILGGICSI